MVDRTSDSAIQQLATTFKGRPKVLYNRVGSVGGEFYPRDLATVVFAAEGFRAVPEECAGGRTVELGEGSEARVSCFRAER